MRKFIKGLGIIGIILAILELAFAGLVFFIAVNTHDATPEHYRQQYQMAFICLIVGIVTLILGIVFVKLGKKRR